MSKLTLAIRFSDNTLSSFKIHKSHEFNSFKNILFLEHEDKLVQFLKQNGYPQNISANNIEQHNDYDNGSALFAPYDYGIVFIDFKTKNIYSYNDYSPFLTYTHLQFKEEMRNLFSSEELKQDPSQLSPESLLLKQEELKKNIDNEYFGILSNIIFNVEHALKHHGKILYKKANISTPSLIISSNLLSALYEILSYETPIDYGHNLKLGSLDSISIKPIKWNIISSDKEHIHELFCIISNIIPKEYHILWTPQTY